MSADAAGNLMRRREPGRSIPARARAEISHILELLAEESWRSVYAGESKCAHQVRLPPAVQWGLRRGLRRTANGTVDSIEGTARMMSA